jgi:hypothetical protein
MNMKLNNRKFEDASGSNLIVSSPTLMSLAAPFKGTSAILVPSAMLLRRRSVRLKFSAALLRVSEEFERCGKRNHSLQG